MLPTEVEKSPQHGFHVGRRVGVRDQDVDVGAVTFEALPVALEPMWRFRPRNLQMPLHAPRGMLPMVPYLIGTHVG